VGRIGEDWLNKNFKYAGLDVKLRDFAAPTPANYVLYPLQGRTMHLRWRCNQCCLPVVKQPAAACFNLRPTRTDR
jgi:hypothetical protein